MADLKAQVPVRRVDYRPPDYWIDAVDLCFELDEAATVVTAESRIRRAAQASPRAPLSLDGAPDMTLLSVAVNGRTLGAAEYDLTEGGLRIPDVPDEFTLRISGQVSPETNRALEGLYVSRGIFCTQCEAEGFRRITWFLDRPDVMATYRTRIEANKQRCPVLLSNGNLVEQGDLPGGRHFATWVDPFKKPSYLFALVAGDLARVEDTFRTQSGRQVALHLFVEADQVNQTAHCLRSLKRAMRWDEERFGREYDLDVYMIVAVRDFNMGAMENKGLNVFNAKYVLARSDTATDADFQNIEAVVAHEYFHNWSGNRVTCRDWFQLSLKEGFTVFRDQEFSADMNGREVQRIQDVQRLLSVQFPEASGPTAHAVRPDEYVEINNFYTPTVYEKGAEVVRMLRTLLGPEGFRAGCDLYFARHDGQAVTCDDFVRAMADASGRDLSQFSRWYSQVGTPIVSVEVEHDPKSRELALHIEQRDADESAPTSPLHIPLRVGLIDEKGEELSLAPLHGVTCDPNAPTSVLLELREQRQTFRFGGVGSLPVVSLLREFSAPVRLRLPVEQDALRIQLAHDSDGYGRWDAAQRLGEAQIHHVMEQLKRGEPAQVADGFLDALRKVLTSDTDPALIAILCALPSEAVLLDGLTAADPSLVHEARGQVELAIGRQLHDELAQRYAALDQGDAFSLDAPAVAKRSLRNLCLRYLTAATGYADGSLALTQFHRSTNMTDMLAALSCLVNVEGADREQALAAFYARFEAVPLVVDKWFAVQAGSSRPSALAEIEQLTQHPAFDLHNPNRARALIDGLSSGNPFVFHSPSGAGYRFVRERVLEVDGFNEQVAARLVVPLTRFGKLEPKRRALLIAELSALAAAPGLSVDVSEQVGKALAAAESAGLSAATTK